jgi:hypothetical protein
MELIGDCFGRSVRLTSERRAHILEHPEMHGEIARVESTLQDPELVRRSISDSAVEMFYRYFADTAVDGKWMCVVVKCSDTDAFVVTAYLTDRPKAGEDVWPPS